MKVRSLSRFFMGMLAMCAIAACSNDELDVNGTNPDPDASGDAVYMNVTVQLPTGAGTRADGGTEVGLDRENEVKDVLLVLASKDDEFIACAQKFESKTPGSNNSMTVVQSVSKTALAGYYDKKGTISTGEEEKELSLNNQKVKVYVFCNPTSDLKTFFAEKKWETDNIKWYDGIATVTQDADGTGVNMAVWGGPQYTGGFLMSSAQVSTKRIPSKLSHWNQFTSMDKPFKFSGINNIDDKKAKDNIEIDNTKTADGGDDVNNGVIKVERSVARFDFKDGSLKEDGKTSNNNTYNVVKDPNSTDENNPSYLVKVQLQKMALVNMSKNFYYLRRVSTDGLGKSETDNGWTLCGAENDNYVVDTDAAEKNVANGITDYTTNFNFCLGNKDNNWNIDEIARGQWYTDKIDKVLGEDSDDDNNSWAGTGTYGDYKIWRYVTENTIPGIANQKNGVSTGIVFKGKMIAVEGTTGSLANALNNAKGESDIDPILYVYGTNIYVSWKEVRAAAIKAGDGDPLYTAAFGTTEKVLVAEKEAKDGEPAVEAVYSDDKESADYLWNEWYNEKDDDGKFVRDKTKLANFKEAAVKKNKFTLYQSSKDSNGNVGYFCYYFYWNRHNDNRNSGVMGSMEFSVVRNNVYKLAVTTIKKLGHPRLSENDPDGPGPDKPDEKEDVYLSVSVQVLPWVVRVNDIEF